MRTVKEEFKQTKKLIEKVLEEVPRTRDSDTMLYLECLKRLGVRNFSEAEVCGLSIVSVHKLRQEIQNKEKRFQPTDDTKRMRREREETIREYFRGGK